MNYSIYKKAQISMEYLIVVGFITFVIIGVLALAVIYSGNIKDRIRINQATGFANKIISSAEKVFYSGAPSKVTISAYLPDNVDEIQIIEDSIIITVQTGSGYAKTSFSSNVPISGTIDSSSGLKKFEVKADEGGVVITKI